MGKNGAKETYSYSKRDVFIQQKRPKRHASRKHGKEWGQNKQEKRDATEEIGARCRERKEERKGSVRQDVDSRDYGEEWGHNKRKKKTMRPAAPNLTCPHHQRR